ncbi:MULTISPECIES: flagellar export chaperone FliS [Modicisalibacter]|uniref:Flagellar secretion chaperone FliS n=1 Tax=Modicisalibacter tunisiensis TaxID=390637 RepID=A0ABS7X1L8_9GAMM|nr:MULTISPECIES: flagellar export chaperone FliS [Modicisalibacter]MBZ9538285.1 flagellar export chaperone FliS [Modicisalibacter tunisiensis]MBZ9568304.1 flagellar export chaperone FliS [Modicisalibacter tunisiensis]
MSTLQGAGAYAQVGVESAVMSATPHQLIVMLFDGALASLKAAKLHLQQGNKVEKGRSLSKAIDIVNNGLAAALDYEKGGDIAANLGALYDYISRLLLQANLRNDEQRIDEAYTLLNDIASAWREIAPQARS